MIAPTALFLNAFANFQLPESLQQFSPLVPALKSNWLMMHVTVMLSSYATLMCGCIFSIAFLFLSFTKQTELGRESEPSNDRSPMQVLGTYESMFQSKQKMLLNQFDQISFRAIGIGFPLLTLGILSGSVWANEAWGSYWSWDPKETWSLITWLIFAIYLHLRLTQKWTGFQSAVLATFGFLILWICFLGVNFVAKGLHSYGWLES